MIHVLARRATGVAVLAVAAATLMSGCSTGASDDALKRASAVQKQALKADGNAAVVVGAQDSAVDVMAGQTVMFTVSAETPKPTSDNPSVLSVMAGTRADTYLTALAVAPGVAKVYFEQPEAAPRVVTVTVH